MYKLIALLIGLTPFNKIRIFLYRILLGYDIDYHSYISPCNIINCKEVHIHGERLGIFNQITVKHLVIEEFAQIGEFN